MNHDDAMDAELIRHLDGEPHGTIAPANEERLTQLRRRSERLSSLLAQTDPTSERVRASAAAIRPLLPPVRSRGLAWWKIAAAVALLLGVTLAVPPARAWVLGRVRAAAAVLGAAIEQAVPPAAAPSTSVAAPEAAIRFSFPVTTDTFDIVQVPAAGTLVIRRNAGRLGTAEASGAPDGGFTIARGLRIDGASATAVYTVTLPARVIAVRVHDRSYELPPRSGQLEIDLLQR